ncbi:Rpn family recombination-promoting nuclease/putative transposase [Sporosarcina sp. Marseille-Q4063]|uniref:Rpn family recombination-promoting nuclease/putative transposase n=1 Tax=Sporosarcina sp. Marseille-Q4063 TaxID=2810514 RepID=UPI001BAF25B0|nr:Rpn family recombination-promoting nuclease/putative transposase [Sporosarcina sp. Marseille-Q4063]QUW23105.1 Rpn family recombination-promoting nuclease/putative transposase [Sporosarcina sp. Marseille-Q4063]
MVLLLRENESKYGLDLLDLRNDFVFKAFFGDKRNNKLLLDFIRAILGEQIISVKLTSPYVEPSHANDKKSEMDLRILTDIGEQINVEMQLKGHRAFTERMLIYWAKMYGVQGKEGKSYVELNKAIQIVITNFNMLRKPHYQSMFQLIDPENGALFSSHMEIHVLELSKVKNLILQDATKLEKWLLFMKGDQETKEALAMESSTMKEAYSEIQRLSGDMETRKAAIAREIHLNDQIQRELDAEADGWKSGKREGKQEGIKEGKTEIVIEMYKEEFPIKTIVKLTGFTEEEILSIVKMNI